MEKFMIFLEPTEHDGKSRSFIHSCRDSDAAKDYAKFLLGVGCGNYHRLSFRSNMVTTRFKKRLILLYSQRVCKYDTTDVPRQMCYL